MVDEKNVDKKIMRYEATYEARVEPMEDESRENPNNWKSTRVYKFEADSEAQAKVLATKYRPSGVISIELTHLVQMREIPLPEKVPLFKSPHSVNFDRIQECLVDKQGNIYRETRFDKITATSFSSSTKEDARSSALEKIVDQAAAKKADAFEIIHVEIHDSHQEYDSTPYSAEAQALLYRKE